MPHPLPRHVALPALLLLAFGGAAPAQGTPRSMAECERLKNDLAYNQCLAMFGPAARNVASGVAAGDAPAAPALPATAPAIPHLDTTVEEPRIARTGHYRARRGRQTAVFTAGSGEGRAYRRRRHR